MTTEADESSEPRLRKLPASWSEVEFNQAFTPVSVNGKKLPAKSYLAAGDLPVIDQGQRFVGGYTNDQSLAIDPGDGVIVFGDHTRCFKRITFPFAPGADGIKVLRPVLTDSKYAYYACQSLQFPNKGYSRHYSHLARTKFPIAPEPEQRRIVSKIEEIFSDIEAGERALERAQKLAHRYRQAVLKAALTGELTCDWRRQNKGQLGTGEALLHRILKARRDAWEEAELARLRANGQEPVNDSWKLRYREPQPPVVDSLPQLPPRWIWASVEQLSTKVVDGVHKKPNYVPAGIPFVTVKNLTAGPGISFDGLKYVSPRDHAEFTKRTDPENGDILVSKDGTLGVVRVVRTDTEFSIFVSVALIKPVLRGMGEYLGIALAAPQVQAQMVPKGSGLQHIHLEDLRQDCVPLCDLPEQQQIVELVDRQTTNVDHIAAEMADYSGSATTLRQATLRAAFSGKLVPQCADDEPASSLLKSLGPPLSSNTRRTASRARRRIP